MTGSRLAGVSIADSLSWARGPKNSRSVRVLLYLAYGSVGSVGVLLVLLVALVLRSGGFGSNGSPSTVGILVLGLLLAVWRGLPVELARRSGGYGTDVLREFTEVRRWRWVAAASLLAFGVLAGVVIGSGVVILGLLLPIGGWLTGFTLAHVLSSAGEIDTETRTLTYGEQRIDLDSLTGARRVQFGGQTFLWLSFESGYSDFVQRLYVLPIPVAERAWPVFETGIACETDVEVAEADRANHRRYVFGALAFFGAGAGVFAMFWWAGAPPVIAALAGMMIGTFGFVLLAAALRVA